MDGEAGPVSGGSQREEKRSYQQSTIYCQEPEGLLNKKGKHSGNSGAELKLNGTESYDFLPAYPVCMPRDRWEERGGEEDIQDKLLHSCCTAEGSPNSMLQYWMHPNNQHNMAGCPVTKTITPPGTPVSHRPCPFIPVQSSVTAIASPVSSVVNPMVSSPMTDSWKSISSMCSPTNSAWDTLRSTSRSPGCSDLDPVRAAAHLHLLGESLSLIGHHLQETNKMVSMSCSSSLLLDSLLCALAPLICLTAQIPELRSCTPHTLASTLENIAYMMPGL